MWPTNIRKGRKVGCFLIRSQEALKNLWLCESLKYRVLTEEQRSLCLLSELGCLTSLTSLNTQEVTWNFFFIMLLTSIWHFSLDENESVKEKLMQHKFVYFFDVRDRRAYSLRRENGMCWDCRIDSRDQDKIPLSFYISNSTQAREV